MKGILKYGRYNDDSKHVGCPRARTDMTPCVARDGENAVGDNGGCVGCAANPANLLTELVKEVTKGLDGNMVAHAKRELELLGEEPDMIDCLIRTVASFASYGHSGGSSGPTIFMLHDLLQFKNLTPLTDDPLEWMHVSDDCWQNARCGEAFSNDGGKTYYLLSEGGNDKHREPLHTSVVLPRACGPTNDVAECACGCSGYDDRCALYLEHYNNGTQVPESHGCCIIPGRTNEQIQKEA